MKIWERLGWTVAAALPGNMTAALAFDVKAWKALAATGIITGLNALSLIARKRLETADA